MFCARSSVDRVFDSDSKDRGFESRRARGKSFGSMMGQGDFHFFLDKTGG